MNEAGQEILHQHGFEFGYTEQRLSPKMVYREKCLGGVNTFIADYLEGQDIETTAKKFEGGIPMEGVLSHEIYKKAGYSYDLNQIALEEGVEKILKQSDPSQYTEISETYNPKDYENLSEEQRYILDNVKSWQIKGFLLKRQILLTQSKNHTESHCLPRIVNP